MQKISYARYRFPPVIIQHAVWLYFRFPLSFRDVEDLLAGCCTFFATKAAENHKYGSDF